MGEHSTRSQSQRPDHFSPFVYRARNLIEWSACREPRHYLASSGFGCVLMSPRRSRWSWSRAHAACANGFEQWRQRRTGISAASADRRSARWLYSPLPHCGSEPSPKSLRELDGRLVEGVEVGDQVLDLLLVFDSSK